MDRSGCGKEYFYGFIHLCQDAFLRWILLMEIFFGVFTVLQIVYFDMLELKIPAYEIFSILEFLYVYFVFFNVLPTLMAFFVSRLNKKIDEAEKLGLHSEINKNYTSIWYWQTTYVVIYNFRAFLNMILSIVFLFQLDSS